MGVLMQCWMDSPSGKMWQSQNVKRTLTMKSAHPTFAYLPKRKEIMCLFLFKVLGIEFGATELNPQPALFFLFFILRQGFSKCPGELVSCT